MLMISSLALQARCDKGKDTGRRTRESKLSEHCSLIFVAGTALERAAAWRISTKQRHMVVFPEASSLPARLGHAHS